MRMRSALAIGISVILFAPCALAERESTLEPSGPAPGGQRRIALVIGNSAYASAPLRNPVNDARAIARALAETGFSVTMVEDATEAAMRRAIRSFGDVLAQTGGVGLFYYAGHAMQLRGRNFLIPLKADIQREDEVEDQAVDANLVLRKMDSAKNSLNIVVLDACRNNPFERSFRSSARGLAQVDAPGGTLVAFATAPGSVAADGEGPNGLYTTHLLRAIREPGLPIEQLFKQVRIGVTRDTADRQVPWESSSLKGNFYFVAPDPSALSSDQRRRQDEAVARAVGEAEARAAKERAALEDKMNALMAQLVARQNAELDAERKKQVRLAAASASGRPASVRADPGQQRDQGDQTLPASKTSPAGGDSVTPQRPVQLASTKPASTGSPAVTALRNLKVGDWWTYRVTDLESDWRRRVQDIVEVRGINPETILEGSSRGKAEPREWVHSAGAYIIGSSPGALIFSPHLGVFQELKIGEAWSNIPFSRVPACDAEGIRCKFSGAITTRERVSVPAGTFDAYRIEIDLVWYLSRDGSQGTRKYTVWYADAVRRTVKVSGRNGEGQYLEPDVDVELIAFEVS